MSWPSGHLSLKFYLRLMQLINRSLLIQSMANWRHQRPQLFFCKVNDKTREKCQQNGQGCASFRWLGLQTTTKRKTQTKIHKFHTASTNHAHRQYANCAKKLFTLWPRPGSSAACLFFDCCTLTDEKPSGQAARLALSDLDAALPHLHFMIRVFRRNCAVWWLHLHLMKLSAH